MSSFGMRRAMDDVIGIELMKIRYGVDFVRKWAVEIGLEIENDNPGLCSEVGGSIVILF